MHRVQAQPVGVEVAHPAQRALDDVGAHLVGARTGEVDPLAPGVGRRRQVGPEPRQVVARRPEVVEHRVDQHTQAAGVAGVDQSHQSVRAAVGFVHRVPQHPVVAPAVGSVERVDRHEFDEVDPEVHQVVQSFDGRVEGALGGEGADVQFVDHRALDRASRPLRRRSTSPRPGSTAAIARAPRQAGGPIEDRAARPDRRRGVVVEDEAVAGAGPAFHLGPPPPVGVAGHLMQHAVDVQAHHVGQRCPDRELSHRCAPAASRAARRTGRRAWTSPANRPPVTRSTQVPAGNVSAVAPQPVSANRTVHRLTATRASSPRRKRHHMLGGRSGGQHRAVAAAQECVRPVPRGRAVPRSPPASSGGRRGAGRRGGRPSAPGGGCPDQPDCPPTPRCPDRRRAHRGRSTPATSGPARRCGRARRVERRVR